MRCPRCGLEALTGDVYCAGCGHEFERTCPGCGVVNRPGARFCVACGVALVDAETAGPGPVSEPGPELLVEPTALDREGIGYDGDQGPDRESSVEPTAMELEGIEYEEDQGPPLWEALLAPEAGLRAWSEPDGSLPVAAELAPHTQVLVLERRGAWARVSVESGWSGWVDGRRLVDPDVPAPGDTPEGKEPIP